MQHRFIISLGSVATIAAYNLVSKNPDIILPPYPETAHWLQDYEALCGLALGRLVLQVHNPNDLGRVEKILSQQHDSACLLLIREPNASLVSWLNACLFHEICKSQSAPDDLTALIGNFMAANPYRDSIKAARIVDTAARQLVLDVSALSASRLESSQQQISRLFGIGNRYGPIMDKENSYFSRFLYEKSLPVAFMPGSLEIKFSGYGGIADNQNLLPLFEFPSPTLWAEVMPENRPITVYLQLTPGFNNYAVPMGQYRFVIEQAKVWIEARLHEQCKKLHEDFQHCMSLFERVKLTNADDIPGSAHKPLLAELAEFYRDKYPEIAGNWN
ncbi:MAG: hypothetical protein CTY29_10145 [Methylobacter sp.]|nr:MAG: hypothetical protein CTY29_10145 [Methylobacter sp.]